jgi:hypothetical protein
MNIKELNEKQLSDYKEEILNKSESEIKEIVSNLLDTCDYNEDDEEYESSNKNLLDFLRDERFKSYLMELLDENKEERKQSELEEKERDRPLIEGEYKIVLKHLKHSDHKHMVNIIENGSDYESAKILYESTKDKGRDVIFFVEDHLGNEISLQEFVELKKL